MKNWIWIGALLGLAVPLAGAQAQGWRKDNNEISIINRKLAGKVNDFTANHGKDNRIWSRSLRQRRDLYVYTPPKYDPKLRYPVMIWLHGFAEDEQSFLMNVAPLLDEAIASGKLPPMIVAAPDGSLRGEPLPNEAGSFWLDTKAGSFETFVLEEMWDFVCHNFSIRSEREAHVLAGVSMGGFGAFNLGIKHHDAFGVVVGFFPPVNLRWMDKDGNYFANFDPKNWGWRTDLKRGHEPIGRFLGGLITLRMSDVIDPIFGRSEEAVFEMIRENPIEMLDRYGIRAGSLEMYIAYGGHDQFNFDAQAESFLYLCKCRGIPVGVGYEPHGTHDLRTAKKLAPGAFAWLNTRLAPYAPIPAEECDGCSPRASRPTHLPLLKGRPTRLP